MTKAQACASDIINCLFDEIAPLAGLRGFERDRLRDEIRRIAEASIEASFRSLLIRADLDTDDDADAAE